MVANTVIIPCFAIFMQKHKLDHQEQIKKQNERQDESGLVLDKARLLISDQSMILNEQGDLLSRIVRASDTTADTLAMLHTQSIKTECDISTIATSNASMSVSMVELSKQMSQVETKLEGLREITKDIASLEGKMDRFGEITRDVSDLSHKVDGVKDVTKDIKESLSDVHRRMD